MTATHPASPPAWPPTPQAPTPRRTTLTRGVVVVVAVVVVFAVVGVAAGWLWHQLWTPPRGEVVRGAWYPARGDTRTTFSTDETSLGAMFGGTGLFVLVGLGGGLVLGVLTALLVRRDEAAAVIGIVLGGAAAAATCHLLGVQLGPTDPASLAPHLPDFTVLPDSLSVTGKPPYVAWVLGAAIGLGIVYLSSSARRRVAVLQDDPTWWPVPSTSSPPSASSASSPSAASPSPTGPPPLPDPGSSPSP